MMYSLLACHMINRGHPYTDHVTSIEVKGKGCDAYVIQVHLTGLRSVTSVEGDERFVGHGLLRLRPRPKAFIRAR